MMPLRGDFRGVVIKRLKQVAKFGIRKLDKRFPKILPLIESELQELQGIGWMSPRISFEVKTAFEFLPNPAKINLVCLDVGAHIGEYSKAILELKATAQIHAFEPDPVSFEILKKNFHLATNVVPHEIALGSSVSERSLFFNEPGSALASLYQRTNLPEDTLFNKSISVNVLTIDSVCQEFGLEPDFIKIDTEGCELEVLKGAADTISEYGPVIQFEFGGTSIDSRTFFIDYWNYFDNIGYSIFRISPGEAKRIERYSERSEVFLPMNYIASKNNRKA